MHEAMHMSMITKIICDWSASKYRENTASIVVFEFVVRMFRFVSICKLNLSRKNAMSGLVSSVAKSILKFPPSILLRHTATALAVGDIATRTSVRGSRDFNRTSRISETHFNKREWYVLCACREFSFAEKSHCAANQKCSKLSNFENYLISKIF